LQVVDPRDDDRQLRVSWHPTKRIVVFSQWRHDVCVATTPVELAEVPAVVGLLVGALEDASRDPSPDAVPSVLSVRRDIGQLIRAWLRPRLAPVVTMAPLPLREQSASKPTDRPL
jgi:hypothetical protein